MAQQQQVKFNHDLVIDRLPKDHLVDAPVGSVRKSYPLNSLIRGVVDRLLDVLIFEIASNGFDLQQKGEATVDLHGEVTEGASYHVLRRDLRILVVTEY